MTIRSLRTRGVTRAAAALGLAVGASCTTFTGPDLSENPNSPSSATSNQLLVSVTSFAAQNLTADFNRVVSIWMQQMAGTGRQWLTYDAPYIIDENSFGSWSTFYTGGGLVDIRQIQTNSRAANDQVYLGIAQVWEALVVSFLADGWGDVPYRQALDPAIKTPALDPQQQVYADLQLKLDSAITNLAGTGAGPGSFDLIYGGDKAKWSRLAHTLKARLYLHTAEKVPGAYALALAQANQGISDPTGDFRTYQSGTVGEQNQWYQFLQGRGTDISAAAYIINLMASRNAGGRDPRFTQYFGTTSAGAYLGAAPGQEGEDFSWLSPTRGDPGYRQPLVTWAETQLIKAEALVQTNDLTGAATALNAERSQAGLSAVATGLTSAQLYQQVMEEKYVALFDNVEVWSDYKRTCWPNLVPGNGARTIPARFFYGADERGANPNLPSPSQQPRRNWNDPSNATALDGSACLGQRTS